MRFALPASRLVVLVMLLTSLCESRPLQTSFIHQQDITAAKRQASIRHSMWFESHGRDDGREWASAILKGAQFIKVDFNFRYKNTQDCLVQTRLPHRSDNYTNGCFILTHYYTQNQTDFNTTFDLVDFIIDPQNSYLFDGSFGKIKFQMCFKNRVALRNATTQEPGTPAWKWFTLMNDFFLRVQSHQYDPTKPWMKNIQFIFNTLPVSEPLALWKPWNSTIDATLVGVNYTNPGTYPPPGEDQAQVLNLEYRSQSGWKRANALKPYPFGKFNSAVQPVQEHPFIGWEPSSEQQLNTWFDQWLEYDFLNTAGVLAAFNPDPSLFHTYTANLTQRFSHQTPEPSKMAINATKTFPLKFQGNTYIITMTQKIISAVALEVCWYAHVRAKHSNLNRVPLSDSTSGHCYVAPPPSSAMPNLLYPGFTATTTSHHEDYWRLDVVLYSRFDIPQAPPLSVGWSFGWNPEGAVLPSTPSITHDERRISQASSSVAPSKSPSIAVGGMIAGVAQILGLGYKCGGDEPNTSNGRSCRRLSVMAFTFPNTTGNFTIQLEGYLGANCSNVGSRYFGVPQVITNHANAGVTTAEPIVDVAVAATLLSVTAAETSFASVAVAVSWSSGRQVFASFLQMELAVNWEELLGDDGSDTLPFSAGIIGISSLYPHPDTVNIPLLGTGMHPSASIQPPPPRTEPQPYSTSTHSSFKDSILLLTYGESFCQNNEVVDDDFGPLKGTKECGVNNATLYEFIQQPVQSYTFGKVRDYITYAEQHVSQRPFQARWGYANTCNVGMFHGIWDFGYRSSAVLLPKDPTIDWNVQDTGYIAVAALKGVEEVFLAVCGAPTVNGGALLLDSFPLFGIYNESTVLNP